MNRAKIEIICNNQVYNHLIELRNGLYDQVIKNGETCLAKTRTHWPGRFYWNININIRNEALNLTGYFK